MLRFQGAYIRAAIRPQSAWRDGGNALNEAGTRTSGTPKAPIAAAALYEVGDRGSSKAVSLSDGNISSCHTLFAAAQQNSLVYHQSQNNSH